jgi:hypothetical protein
MNGAMFTPHPDKYKGAPDNASLKNSRRFT